MGLLSKLFGIPSFGGATNSLLVELVLPSFTHQQKKQLKAQLVEVFRRGGFPRTPPEVALERINRSTRIAQLNCLALALNELGYQPPLRNEFWHDIRNPFDAGLADDTAVWSVSQRLKSTHGVEVTIGREPINFNTW